MHLRSLLLPLALPTMLAAAEPQVMRPTPAKPPAPIGRHNHLTDRVIPAYGMNLHRASLIDLSTAQLVAEIRRLVGEVDARVMGSGLHRGAPTLAMPTEKRGKQTKTAVPQSLERQPLEEEKRLMALVEALTKRELQLRPEGISAPIPEQQMIDEAFADLSRAAASLSFGLGDELYTNLEAQHSAWQQRYRQALDQARATKIAELTSGPKKLTRAQAEAAVANMDLISELPAVEDTPATEAPSEPVVPTVPAPDMPAVPVDQTPPTPADELPPVEPAVVPVAPVDELPPVEPEGAPIRAPVIEVPAAEEALPPAMPEALPEAEAAPAAESEPVPAAEPVQPADAGALPE